jgi:class 3 adenylate cyclase
MVDDVADWLRRLGLEQYAPVFTANDVDGEILPELTPDDLLGLGITSIGHRRKLLAAIAAFRSDAPVSATETAPVSAAVTSSEAERRQLSVMFCDLVGSTPLSARYDPEDLRDVIGAYSRCVADTVARFAGFVAKYMGDGVLIYFGYPEAHEDDPERAVRAGLAIIDAVGGLATPEPLNVRLGVASGLVVVGDLIGAGAAQERGVVGETRISPHGCRRWPNRARSSLPKARGGKSVRCSKSRISSRNRSPVLPNRSALGAWPAKAACSAASRRCARRLLRSSGAMRSLTCCCGAGSRRKRARGGSC